MKVETTIDKVKLARIASDEVAEFFCDGSVESSVTIGQFRDQFGRVADVQLVITNETDGDLPSDKYQCIKVKVDNA